MSETEQTGSTDLDSLGTDYQGMHWSALKKLVEARGMAYEGKEQAIAFLSAALPIGQVKSPQSVVTGGKFLDKKQPYGDIFGEVENAPDARYIQGGNYYNGAGEKVG